jgi:hypothetical protein
MSLFSTGPSFDFANSFSSWSSPSTQSSSSFWSAPVAPMFSFSSTPAINIQANYKDIAKQFSKKYYENYDSDYNKLEAMYLPTAMFTYLEEEFLGFANFKKKLQQLNIKSFQHSLNTIDVQPINQDKLYIMMTGTMSVNGDFSRIKFSEFICLSKGSNDNNFYISNTMFRIVTA